MAAFLAERAVAINAVLRASKVCQNVFKHFVSSETITKKDKSPVTVADFSAQAVVNTILQQAFPNDPIVGEEDSGDLRGDDAAPFRQKVLESTNSVLDNPIDEDKLLKAIDRGSYVGGFKGRFWTLDPIDGTKGFVRGDQYAVCLALIVDGHVQLGVMGCPNLQSPDGERGCLFVTVKNQGAFQRKFSSSEETVIHISDILSVSEGVFCESVESQHSAHDQATKIAALLGITRPPIRADSQCKYALVSRGDANIYLRLPVSKTYQEKIWDHATGALLVTEAGGIVSDIYGKPLDFSLGRTLVANAGIIASDPKIYSQVLDAVRKVVSENE